MKNVLYGTTALVAAGALVASPASAEEKIKLGLGGYMNNYFGMGSQDSSEDTSYGPTGLFSDGEIWFQGETTLDNGITFGANVQLESFGPSTRGGTADVIDEDFAYIVGSFGRFNIGSENSAAYLMHYSAPNVGAPINSGWISTFVPADDAQTGGGGFRTPRLSTNLDWNNDENVITYFTPRFAGFQLGVTYAPTVSGSGDGANLPVQADKDTEFNNGFAAGINYVDTLGPVDLAVSGGFRFAKAPDDTGLQSAGQLDGKDSDLKQYSMGVNLGWAGFTFGGSYAQESSGRATDGKGWDAGVSYGTGPWAVGVTYFGSEVKGRELTAPGSGVYTRGDDDDKVNALEAGVSYAVGPGITASASFMFVDWEGGNDEDSKGGMGIIGLKYNF